MSLFLKKNTLFFFLQKTNSTTLNDCWGYVAMGGILSPLNRNKLFKLQNNL